jgi:hypothetical protein
MPLTEKGEKILDAMEKEYGKEKGEQVFYASKNAGKISGVDAVPTHALLDKVLRVAAHMTRKLGKQDGVGKEENVIDAVCDAIDASRFKEGEKVCAIGGGAKGLTGVVQGASMSGTRLKVLWNTGLTGVVFPKDLEKINRSDSSPIAKSSSGWPNPLSLHGVRYDMVRNPKNELPGGEESRIYMIDDEGEISSSTPKRIQVTKAGHVYKDAY